MSKSYWGAKRVKQIISAAAFAMAIVSTTALAQIRDLPPSLPEGAIGCLTSDGLNSLRVQLRGAQRTATAPLNTSCPRGAVLSAFSMAFQGDDHKLNTIGILREDGNIRFDMADQNGDDRFLPSAKFLVSGRIRSSELTLVGSGEMTADLPAGPAGTVPVLQGFKFFRAEGHDANLRLIGVQIMEDQTVRVALLHDGGADFRNLEGMIGDVIGMSLIPLLGPLIATAVPSADAAATMLYRYPDTHYAATVQIAWVPESMIVSSDTMGGTRGGGRRPRTEGARPAEGDFVGLRGFRFFFENSDHHLKDLKVMPTNASTPAKMGDSDGEDPYAWVVDYVVLQ